MREHKGELSQACKNHIAEEKEQQKEFSYNSSTMPYASAVK